MQVIVAGAVSCRGNWQLPCVQSSLIQKMFIDLLSCEPGTVVSTKDTHTQSFLLMVDQPGDGEKYEKISIHNEPW